MACRERQREKEREHLPIMFLHGLNTLWSEMQINKINTFVHVWVNAYVNALDRNIYIYICESIPRPIFVEKLYSLGATLLVHHRSNRERRGLVHYQGTMNNTDPPESSSGLVHTHIHYDDAWLYCVEKEKGKKIPAWGLNGVWQAHLPFSETNAQLWQPWQPWIVVATLSLNLLHPSNSATQYIPADCELHLSQISLKLIKELQQQGTTVSKPTRVKSDMISPSLSLLFLRYLWYRLVFTFYYSGLIKYTNILL